MYVCLNLFRSCFYIYFLQWHIQLMWHDCFYDIKYIIKSKLYFRNGWQNGDLKKPLSRVGTVKQARTTEWKTASAASRGHQLKQSGRQKLLSVSRMLPPSLHHYLPSSLHVVQQNTRPPACPEGVLTVKERSFWRGRETGSLAYKTAPTALTHVAYLAYDTEGVWVSSNLALILNVGNIKARRSCHPAKHVCLACQ